MNDDEDYDNEIGSILDNIMPNPQFIRAKLKLNPSYA
jgi:hypothetical protein